MSNTIKKIISNTVLALRDREIRVERERLAKEKDLLAAREKQMQDWEAERTALQARRDSLLDRQVHLEKQKVVNEGRLAKSITDTDDYFYHHVTMPQNVGASTFMDRIFSARRLQGDLRILLDKDIPAASKRLAQELDQVDAEIAAFEKKDF